VNPLAAIAAVAVAYGAYRMWSGSGGPSAGGEGPEQSTPTGAGVTYAKGLRTAHNGIKMPARLITAAIAIRAECSYVICPELTITSGQRDEFGQSRAMITYLATFGEAKFVGLYKNAARELLKIPQVNWPAKIKEMYEVTKLLNAGGHYGGGALDFRLGTDAQNAELIRAALKVGSRKAYFDGPCIHVDVK
jgi:hypothetical protein